MRSFPWKSLMRNSFRLIGVAVFAIVIWKIDLHQMRELLVRVDVATSLIVLLCVLIHLTMKVLRWRSLLAVHGVRRETSRLFKVYMAGTSIGLATPGRVGEATKALYISRTSELSFGKAFSTVALDLLFDIALLAIVAAVGIVYYHAGLVLEYTALAAPLAGILLITLIVAIIRPLRVRVRRVFSDAIKKILREKIHFQIRELYYSLGELARSGIVMPILYTVIAYGFFALVLFLLADMLGMQVSLFYIFTAVASASIISLIPVTIAGLGTRDLVYLAFFTRVGVPAEVAIGLSLLYLASFIVFTAFIGAICYFSMSSADMMSFSTAARQET